MIAPPTCNHPLLKDRRRELRKNQTDTEKKLWRALRGRRILGFKFFRQYSVGVYILDFFCPTARLAIEIDGGHHDEENQKEYDRERTAFLEGQDIQVLRFWNNEVRDNLQSVLEKITEVAGIITPPSLPLP